LFPVMSDLPERAGNLGRAIFLRPVRPMSGPSPTNNVPRVLMDNWLDEQFTVLNIPMQNWMVVSFALILIAALITIWDRT